MKKVFLILCIATMSCVDKNEVFTGYLVCKEYTPSHMSNQNEKTVSYTIVAPHVFVAKPVPPHRISEKWVLFVANRDNLIQKETDKKTFDSLECGQKISFKRYQ